MQKEADQLATGHLACLLWIQIENKKLFGWKIKELLLLLLLEEAQCYYYWYQYAKEIEKLLETAITVSSFNKQKRERRRRRLLVNLLQIKAESSCNSMLSIKKAAILLVY